MKRELKNWRTGEQKRRRSQPNPSVLQFLSSSVLLLLLAACGFQPLHSKAYRVSQPIDLSMLDVQVRNMSADQTGFRGELAAPRRYAELLRAELLEQAPDTTAAPKQFRFEIAYTEGQTAQFVNPDGTASRGELVYSSTYTVTRLADMKIVNAGSIARTTSFNTAPNADYTSYVSLEDARKRCTLELAQAYKLRLAQLMPVLANPQLGEVKADETDQSVPELRPAPSYETLRQRH